MEYGAGALAVATTVLLAESCGQDFLSELSTIPSQTPSPMSPLLRILPSFNPTSRKQHRTTPGTPADAYELGSIVSGVFTPVRARHSKSFPLIDCIATTERMRNVYQKVYREYLTLAVARPDPAVRKGPSCCFRAKLLRCSSECVVSLLLRFKTRSRSLTIHCSRAFPSVIFRTCKASPMPHIQQVRNIWPHS